MKKEKWETKIKKEYGKTEEIEKPGKWVKEWTKRERRMKKENGKIEVNEKRRKSGRNEKPRKKCENKEGKSEWGRN